ncbi:sporulation protein [Anaerobacillus sp. MEB173]|uniref:sporulation protein n=1 Tax=Anaerobacillus sp. MEB173 TaxID=3383345 RepID=UPI003F92881B
MFEKVLSSIGIGSAKVNTLLFENRLERGKETKGEIHIYGGKAEQVISEILVQISLEFNKYYDEMTDFRELKETILELKMPYPLIIAPKEEKVLPFSLTIPYTTPISFSEQQIRLQTELKINMFNHPVCKHNLIVVDPFIDEILTLLSKRRFIHQPESGLCRFRVPSNESQVNYVQTFHLRNAQGVDIRFVGNAKDIDMFIYEQDNESHCLVKREHSVMQQLENFFTKKEGELP